MKFYYFHLMPYVMEHDEPSSWVTLSNRHYDPAVGHTLYHQYLDQLEYAEALGWDGICVNEHHQNCYGTMPSPNVMAAMLVRRTTRARIAILGNGLPLRENPLRIAEEIAMLDVVSGGRIVSGFVRGIGARVLLDRGEPHPLARAVLRGGRPHLEGLDRAGPVRLRRALLPLSVREPVAAAAAAAAPARVVPVAGLAARRSSGRRSGASRT